MLSPSNSECAGSAGDRDDRLQGNRRLCSEVPDALAGEVFSWLEGQALYVLSRLLQVGANPNLRFEPENREDLSICDGDSVVEVVQVKAHMEPLTISDLRPDSPESFFVRACGVLADHPSAHICLASYGPIGPEILACKHEESTRDAVARRISSHGHLSIEEAARVLGRLYISQLDEEQMRLETLGVLRSSGAGADPEVSLDLLMYRMYLLAA